MTFAGAIFLIVVGAILRWGVHLHIKHINEHVIGLILIIAGIVGLVIAIFQTTLWANRTRRADRHADRYPDEPR